MSAPAEQWKLLRTKADETVDDTDWVGTNVAPASAICGQFPEGAGYEGRAYTGIEVVVLGVTDAGVPQARGTMTFDMTLIEVIERGVRAGVALDPIVCVSQSVAGIAVQAKTYWPLNGARRFSMFIANDTNDAVDNLEIWWRPVCR